MNGRNSVGFDEFLEMSNDQRDRLSIDQLNDVRTEIEAVEADAKEARKAYIAACLRRCEPLGRATLKEQGKDVGSATLPTGVEGLGFSFEIPKKVEWDQKLLRKAVNELAAQGEDVEEYVTFEIKVSENKYNAWPNFIKNKFMPARTVKPGTMKAEIIETKKKS